VAEVVLFHHAQGQTQGSSSSPTSCPAGHTVHTPDLSDECAQEDLPAAEELVATVDDAELFLYPGDRHLFADPSLDDYDEQAAAQLRERVLAFLKRVD
jgi:dienelactone hydrolase